MLTKVVHKGSALGSILLLSGGMIGAGMLGLPIASGPAGFFPSLLVFVFCWAFMLITGLLVLEVNVWLGKDVHIVSMAEKALGRFGKIVAWVVYIFLFYCLLTAYLDANAHLISLFFEKIFSIHITPYLGVLLVSVLLGIVIFLGDSIVDYINRLFMLGLIITYLGLLLCGFNHIEVDLYKDFNFRYMPLAIPVVIISFGFHNLVPTLLHYVKGGVKAMLPIIIYGSAAALVIYLLWMAIVLGIIPCNTFIDKATEGMASGDITEFINSPWIRVFINYFAFFAITTSFLAQALSLVDFLADGLKARDTYINRFLMVLLAIAPPAIFSIISPGTFITALGYAGGIGAMILFAILPALMVWQLRYRLGIKDFTIIPGGKIVLYLVLVIASCVILAQVLQKIIPENLLYKLF